MKVTIKDVAKAANVSRGTVDRVLYNRPGVSELSKLKVQKAIEELGYKPNSLAQALATSRSPKTIHAIVAPSFNPYVDEVLKGIKNAQREYSDYGLKIKVHVHKNFVRGEQLGVLRRLKQEGCDGLMLSPVMSSAVADAINDLAKAGTPIVIYNSDLPGTDRLCFVGQDQFQSGRTAGALMDKAVKKGNVAIIMAMNDLMCHQARSRGFESELGEGIKIIATENNNDKDELAYEEVLRILGKCSGNLQGIYITGGGVAGAAKALEESGRQHDVTLICHDITAVSKKLIKNGTVDYIIGQDPEYQAHKSVSILFDYLYRGLKPTKDRILTNIDVRLRTNID